ncbi:hypothetical protein QA538_10675 [Macrococcus sp. CCM 2573]
MSNLWREEHKASYLIKKKTTGVASILFCSILVIGYTGESNAAEVLKKNVTISSPSIVLDRHIIDGYLSFDENRDGISDIALSDIQIDLMQNEKVIDSTFTRNNGYFRFVNLPKGEFTLKISRVIIPGEDVNQIDWTKRTIFQKVVVDNSNIVRRYIILNKKSVVETPTTETPTTEAPTTEIPTTEMPTTETPTTEIPTTEIPTTETPTTEIPTTEIPTTETPTTEIPTTEMPTTETPTTEMPTTEAPTTEIPTTEIPTTEMPTTEIPTTEAPTTEAPTTETPTTEIPTTEIPTTEPPTIEIPTTEASTTEMLTMEIDISGNTQSAEDKELRDVHTSRIEMQDDLRFLAKDNSEVVKDRNEHLIQDDKISVQDNNRRKLQKSISGYPVSREDDTSFPHIEKTQIEVVVSDKLSSGNLRGLTTFASNIGGLLLTH